jgi:hypothetical protein
MFRMPWGPRGRGNLEWLDENVSASFQHTMGHHGTNVQHVRFHKSQEAWGGRRIDQRHVNA